MLSRYERDVTVQSIVNQIPSVKITNNSVLSEKQSLSKDNSEVMDATSQLKKCYDLIDDSLIVNDVRLCINDMILFLTSNIYQTRLLSSTSILTSTTTTATTSQSSSPLSVSFHDLSLISTSTTNTTASSLPSTPSTPHSRFHRSITRFSSATNQDHSFNTEHILRYPTSTFSRCIDTSTLTPSLTIPQSSFVGKKRRKNKTKQQSNELVLNVNNNNNKNIDNIKENVQQKQQQQTFTVILSEDCADYVVIDDKSNNDWSNGANRNFDKQTDCIR